MPVAAKMKKLLGESDDDNEDLMDKQGEVADLIKIAESIVESLRDAESCETAEDFEANLNDAKNAAKELASEMKPLMK